MKDAGSREISFASRLGCRPWEFAGFFSEGSGEGLLWRPTEKLDRSVKRYLKVNDSESSLG
jgi:hypothetical protein